MNITSSHIQTVLGFTALGYVVPSITNAVISLNSLDLWYLQQQASMSVYGSYINARSKSKENQIKLGLRVIRAARQLPNHRLKLATFGLAGSTLYLASKSKGGKELLDR